MPQPQTTHPSGLETSAAPSSAPRSDQELVDEASVESFPASDAPSFTPTHAGTPVPAGPISASHVDIRTRLRAHVERLAGTIGERNDQSTDAYARLGEAAEYVSAAFLDAGHAVTRYPFGSPRKVENIEVEIRGTRVPDEVVVIGAHYDSIVRGPGADDDASGVAILIALSRILGGLSFARTVRLVAFANEERPHTHRATMGSHVYVERIVRENRTRIVGMLNLQGLGWFGPPPRDFLAIISNGPSRGLMRIVQAAFHGATRLPVRAIALPAFLPLVSSSDHASFWKHGARAVMLTDTGPLRSRHYHADSDTPDRLDYERMAEVVPGVAAAVADVAGRLH